MAVKKRASRKGHNPTDKDRANVKFLAAIGTPQDAIARIVGISGKPLRQHYRNELDLGMVEANSAVAHNLYRIATGNTPQAVTAAIFWAKTRMGWKEPVEPEKPGGGVSIEFKTIYQAEPAWSLERRAGDSLVSASLARIPDRGREAGN